MEIEISISTEDCWLWAGRISKQGYGVYYERENGKWHSRPAHRLMYENFKGEIPEGLVLDHLCRITQCVNPEHLEAVTQQVNTIRGVGPAAVAYRRNACAKGHEYVEGSFIWASKKTGRPNRKCRQCLKCAVKNTQAYRARKKALSE